MEQEKLYSSNRHIRRKANWVAFFAFSGALAVVVIGYFYSIHTSNLIDQNDRADLLTKVQTIAHLTNAADLAALTGTDADLSSPAYDRIKNMLYDVHNTNGGAKFVYFMRDSGKNDNKLIFLADSEDPESKDYSPPGQVYEDTSPLEMKNYIDANAFVEGPYTDQWGMWVSGYAPVWYQGNLVGIFGMDIDASKWESQNHIFQKSIFGISIFVMSWFVLLGLYIYHKIVHDLKCHPEQYIESKT